MDSCICQGAHDAGDGDAGQDAEDGDDGEEFDEGKAHLPLFLLLKHLLHLLLITITL
ncbi:MAG: hypothetical protein DDT34_01611 [Firmicutes bacterium]|nr:hypothetical protein [Bacillota bacterium]